MSFDDAASERERETKAAALLVELSGLGFVRGLDPRLLGDDDDGAADSVRGVDSTLGNDRGRSGVFAHNRSKDTFQGFRQTSGITGYRRAGVLAAERQVHIAIRCRFDPTGRLSRKREHVERLPRERQGARIELGDVAEFRHDCDETRARFFRFVDHVALALVECRLAVALQHSQIAADHARGGAELVHRERQQLRISVKG
jgi:hypothetical protein